MENWARAAGFTAILTVALAGSVVWGFGEFWSSSHDCGLADVAHVEDKKHLYECLLTEYTRQLAAFTKLLAVATAFLVIVTAGLVFFAYRQFDDTRIMQRAYLAIEPMGIEPFSGAIKTQSNAMISIRNAGHLPATDVRWAIVTEFRTERLWRPPDVKRLAQGSNVIAPTASMLQGSDAFGFDFSNFPELRKHFIYVWGYVIYADGFGRRTRINFCHRYNCANLTDEKIVSEGHRIPKEKAREGRFGNSVQYDYST